MSERPAEGQYPIIVMTVSWNRNEPDPGKAIFLNVLTPGSATAIQVYTALNLAQQRLVMGMSSAIGALMETAAQGDPDPRDLDPAGSSAG